MKSKILLDSFIRYCEANPEQRFWQALRNWSGWHFIVAMQGTTEQEFADQWEDTFYWETNKNPNE